MKKLYKGILIDESLDNPETVLKYVKVVGKRETRLEGEAFRGKVLFYNIEVAEDDLHTVLQEVASSIKSPGWFFHLVGEDILYIAMPGKVMSARNQVDELNHIIEYAESHGIHSEQLNLKPLFINPYA